MLRLLLSLLLSLGIASSSSAVSMDWTFVGNPGNACDDHGSAGCVGAVSYRYNIGTFEVTNAQYVEFLNAKAAADPLGLYNPSMGNAGFLLYGGITRSGVSGSYTSSAIAGRGNMPVNWVTPYDAMRFANWMNNGQGSGDTETGAYTLLGGTETPSNGTTVARNANATIALTSENEWYKAAYYDAVSTSFFHSPTASNTVACSTPTATPNRANCGSVLSFSGGFASVGSYTGSASAYGTFDQGGNVEELNESIGDANGSRGIRGGHYRSSSPVNLSTATWGYVAPGGYDFIGFRLAMIPEPSTGLLVIAGLIGLAGWRRVIA